MAGDGSNLIVVVAAGIGALAGFFWQGGGGAITGAIVGAVVGAIVMAIGGSFTK